MRFIRIFMIEKITGTHNMLYTKNNYSQNVLIEYFADGSFVGDTMESIVAPTELPSAKYSINTF